MSRSRFACLLVSLLSSGCVVALAGALVVLLLVAAALNNPPLRRQLPPPSTSTRTAPPPWVADATPFPNCRPSAECCRVCQRGRACGNGCISERLTCRKPQGCACDAAELCP